MKFVVNSAKLTGDTSNSDWVQVHDYKPEEKEKLEKRGHFYSVISAKINESGMDRVVIGREIVTRLHEEYFGKLDSSAFNALTQAVNKVSEEFADSLGEVEIGAVSYVSDTVFSAATGGAKVVILRNKMLADILASTKNVVSASGHPKEDDVLILGTKVFFQSFSDEQIKTSLKDRSVIEASEILAPSAHSAENSGQIGCVILKFGRESLFETQISEDPTTSQQQTKISKKSSTGVFGKINKRLTKIGGNLPERQIRVREHSLDEAKKGGRRKVAASVGIILLALLSVSIFFGVRQKQQKDYEESYVTRLSESRHQFEEAVNLFEIDPKRARELLIESKGKVDAMINEGIDAPEVLDLNRSIEESTGLILGEYKVDPELFLDLSLLSDGFSGKELSSSDDRVFVLSEDGEKIVSIEINTKRSEVVVGPSQLDGADKIASYSDRVFVIESGEIFEVSEDEKELIEELGVSEILIKAYAGNLYSLEKSLSVIWRIPGSENGFSSKQNWLAEGVEPDFTEIVSWSIDGTIWMINKKGEVSRYSLGNKVNFEIIGVFPPVSSGSDIYTNDELELLYILDPSEGRLVVLDKEGEYKAQYLSDEIKNTSKFIVSEEEKKIILLAKEKLLFIEIKHL